MKKLTSLFAVSIALFFLSDPAFSQCLSTGQSYPNLSLTFTSNRYLRQNARIFPGIIPDLPRKNHNPDGSPFGWATVYNTGQNGQNIQLDIFAINVTPASLGRKVEAFARGVLSREFVVCGDQTGGLVAAQISFRAKRVGRVVSFLPGSTASTSVIAKVTDTETNRDVDFRVLENTSVGNLFGAWKMIAKIPVPIPEGQTVSDELQESVVQTVALQLIRGRKYRFQFRAEVRAIAGFGASVNVIPPFGSVNFATNLLNNPPALEALGFGWTPPDLLGFEQDPGIELLDFRIDVTADQADEISNLKTMVKTLQDSMSLLSSQLENYDPSLGERIVELEESNDIQDSNIVALQDDQAQLSSDISDIQNGMEKLSDLIGGLQGQIDALRDFTVSHTHEYLTGEGEGHNNTKAITSPPSEVNGSPQ